MVSSCEVEAGATGLERDKNDVGCLACPKAVKNARSVFVFERAVVPHELVACVTKERLDLIKHLGELREDWKRDVLQLSLKKLTGRTRGRTDGLLLADRLDANAIEDVKDHARLRARWRQTLNLGLGALGHRLNFGAGS